jgi:hypothetical protein
VRGRSIQIVRRQSKDRREFQSQTIRVVGVRRPWAQTSRYPSVHHIIHHKEPVGFIENTSDPDGLAGLGGHLCETKFDTEWMYNDGRFFLSSTDMSVVCVDCYASLKDFHQRGRRLNISLERAAKAAGRALAGLAI